MGDQKTVGEAHSTVTTIERDFAASIAEAQTVLQLAMLKANMAATKITECAELLPPTDRDDIVTRLSRKMDVAQGLAFSADVLLARAWKELK